MENILFIPKYTISNFFITDLLIIENENIDSKLYVFIIDSTPAKIGILTSKLIGNNNNTIQDAINLVYYY